MIVSFLFLLVCLSGSILGFVFLYDKPLRLVPISIMSLVGVLYIFGLLGILEAGFYVTSFLVVIIYLIFLWLSCEKKQLGKFSLNQYLDFLLSWEFLLF